jgi:threonine dehydrogenase-like Zn-dependent dehydrogenase
MKAVMYKVPYQVAVEDVPEPKIEAANDAIVRITTTNICGSDLHMYEGRTAVERSSSGTSPCCRTSSPPGTTARSLPG